MLTDKNISWNKLAAFSLCGLLFSLPLSIVAVEIFSGLFVIFSILSLSIFKINLDRINLVVFLIIFFKKRAFGNRSHRSCLIEGKNLNFSFYLSALVAEEAEVGKDV